MSLLRPVRSESKVSELPSGLHEGCRFWKPSPPWPSVIAIGEPIFVEWRVSSSGVAELRLNSCTKIAELLTNLSVFTYARNRPLGLHAGSVYESMRSGSVSKGRRTWSAVQGSGIAK